MALHINSKVLTERAASIAERLVLFYVILFGVLNDGRFTILLCGINKLNYRRPAKQFVG